MLRARPPGSEWTYVREKSSPVVNFTRAWGDATHEPTTMNFGVLGVLVNIFNFASLGSDLFMGFRSVTGGKWPFLIPKQEQHVITQCNALPWLQRAARC